MTTANYAGHAPETRADLEFEDVVGDACTGPTALYWDECRLRYRDLAVSLYRSGHDLAEAVLVMAQSGVTLYRYAEFCKYRYVDPNKDPARLKAGPAAGGIDPAVVPLLGWRYPSAVRAVGSLRNELARLGEEYTLRALSGEFCPWDRGEGELEAPR